MLPEEIIKEAFYETFSREYIDLLERKPYGEQRVELLWMAFCHGYIKGRGDERNDK